MREWNYIDTALIGLFLIVFSRGIDNLIILLWGLIHEPSLNKCNEFISKLEDKINSY